MTNNNIKIKTMVTVALLIALEVVLTRFCSIQTPYNRIGFGFVPIAICGMMFGPVWAGVAAGISDILGATLFPTVGAYFFGFTISAVLMGVVYGLCFHNRTITWKNVALAVGINGLVVSLFVTTAWISLLYGSPYFTLIPTRILQNAITIPVHFVTLRVLLKPVELYAHKQLA